MNLASQPEYQRAMQNALSKASMQGQRPRTQGLQTALATQNLERQNQFRQLALQKQRSDLSHRGRVADLGFQRQALKDRQAALPWTIGIGGAGALFSAIEGRKRAKALQAQTEAMQAQQAAITSYLSSNEAKQREGYKYTPLLGGM